MSSRLYFNVRDIPSAARSGLSARKLWIFWKAQLSAWLIWFVSVYLGYLAAGSDLASRWETSRLLPLPGGIFWESWPSVALLAAGLLLIVYVIMAASIRVSRITFDQISGDDFFSGRDARTFLRQNRNPLISTPLAILTGLVIAAVSGLILGLVGRIPGAGPVLLGVLSVPAWGMALLAVLLGLGCILSFVLVPPIVAATRGDTFESLFELFSTLTAQPWRVLLYWLTGLICRTLGLILLMLFASAAMTFLSWTVSLGMGTAGLGASLSSGLQMVAPEVFPWFANAFNPVAAAAPGQSWTGLAGVIAGLSGVAILMIIKAYWLSSGSSAWTLIYLAVGTARTGKTCSAGLMTKIRGNSRSSTAKSRPNREMHPRRSRMPRAEGGVSGTDG